MSDEIHGGVGPEPAVDLLAQAVGTLGEILSPVVPERLHIPAVRGEAEELFGIPLFQNTGGADIELRLELPRHAQPADRTDRDVRQIKPDELTVLIRGKNGQLSPHDPVKDHDIASRYRPPARAKSETAQPLKPLDTKIYFQQSLLVDGRPPQYLRKLVRVGGLQLREKSPFVDHWKKISTRLEGERIESQPTSPTPDAGCYKHSMAPRYYSPSKNRTPSVELALVGCEAHAKSAGYWLTFFGKHDGQLKVVFLDRDD